MRWWMLRNMGLCSRRPRSGWPIMIMSSGSIESILKLSNRGISSRVLSGKHWLSSSTSTGVFLAFST